jgi:hypothetical protein
MLANEAMELIKFKTMNDYKVGKMDVEYMSSVMDELATLETEGFSISLNVTGDCRFDYEQEIFETQGDLVGRPNVIKAMRDDTISYHENPWFEVQYNDADGELIDGDITEIKRLPTTLEAKSLLVSELNRCMVEHGKALNQKQIDMMNMLPGFKSITINLDKGVRVNSIQHKMTDFLVQNEDLLQVLGAVEMDSRKDEYNEKWFTFFCYCSNDDAMREIRAEVLKYGKIW